MCVCVSVSVSCSDSVCPCVCVCLSARLSLCPGSDPVCRMSPVLEEVRIIRACGFANDTKECSGSRNTEVIINSCQCFTDLCNSVGVTQLAPVVLLAAAVLRAALH